MPSTNSSSAGEWETVPSKREQKQRKHAANNHNNGHDETGPSRKYNAKNSQSMSIDEEILSKYIAFKCEDHCVSDDFDPVVRAMLGVPQTPLFQAIQVVHKFNACVNEHVFHRRNYLIGILKKTRSIWEQDPKYDQFLSMREQFVPGTVVQLYELCKRNPDGFSADVLSPSVCLALLLLREDDFIDVTYSFIDQHEDCDSFHRKQQLLVELCEQVDPSRASLLIDDSNDRDNSGTASAANSGSWADQVSNGIAADADATTSSENIASSTVNTPVANALSESILEDYSPEAEAEAAAKLPSMLNAYIATKCSTNENIKKSDFDGTAREALKRMSFLQALQAIEHFAGSVSPRINKRPAYLMGILRGQDQHWDKSRAAAQCPGGSVELLNLSPVVLMKIADLCLHGNCMPSDFTPEVCLALRNLTPLLACTAILAFNTNKRIVAGYRGGVGNRPRFFQRLIQNVAEQHGTVDSPADPKAEASVAAPGAASPVSSTSSKDENPSSAKNNSSSTVGEASSKKNKKGSSSADADQQSSSQQTPRNSSKAKSKSNNSSPASTSSSTPATTDAKSSSSSNAKTAKTEPTADPEEEAPKRDVAKSANTKGRNGRFPDLVVNTSVSATDAAEALLSPQSQAQASNNNLGNEYNVWNRLPSQAGWKGNEAEGKQTNWGQQPPTPDDNAQQNANNSANSWGNDREQVAINDAEYSATAIAAAVVSDPSMLHNSTNAPNEAENDTRFSPTLFSSLPALPESFVHHGNSQPGNLASPMHASSTLWTGGSINWGGDDFQGIPELKASAKPFSPVFGGPQQQPGMGNKVAGLHEPTQQHVKRPSSTPDMLMRAASLGEGNAHPQHPHPTLESMDRRRSLPAGTSVEESTGVADEPDIEVDPLDQQQMSGKSNQERMQLLTQQLSRKTSQLTNVQHELERARAHEIHLANELANKDAQLAALQQQLGFFMSEMKVIRQQTHAQLQHMDRLFPNGL